MGITSLRPVYDKFVDIAFDMCSGNGVAILRQWAALAFSFCADKAEHTVNINGKAEYRNRARFQAELDRYTMSTLAVIQTQAAYGGLRIADANIVRAIVA